MTNKIFSYNGDANNEFGNEMQLPEMELNNSVAEIAGQNEMNETQTWRRKKMINEMRTRRRKMLKIQTVLDLREVVGHVQSIQSLYDVLKNRLGIKKKTVDKKVSGKMTMSGFNKNEAVADVFIDCLLENLRSLNGAMSERALLDTAMLKVVSNKDLVSEMTILLLVDNLIQRGAIAKKMDSDKKRPLQHAVERNFKSVVKLLLQIDVSCLIADDKIGITLLEIAIDNANDDMCVILIHHMLEDHVRSLFENTPSKEDQGTLLHRLILCGMKKSILSLLDCIVEIDNVNEGREKPTFRNWIVTMNQPPSPKVPTLKLRVYNKVLDSDTSGRCPEKQDFDYDCETPFQMLAKAGYTDIICHAAVQGLMKTKWNKYGKFKLGELMFLYLFNLFCVTFSAIVAAEARDPRVYDSSLQYARAVFEIISLLMLSASPIIEIYIWTGFERKYFWRSLANNIISISQVLLTFVVPPLRFTDNGAQWYVFAFGYLYLNSKIISLGVLYRHIGVYLRVIFRIIIEVYFEMLVLIIFILIMFSGMFFLALRADNDLNVHNETSTYGRVWIVVVRSLIEDNAVVEYSGDNGYKVFSGIVMGIFLVVCIVIFFNLLIAKVNESYHKIQKVADTNFAVSRMGTINSMRLKKDLIKKYHVPVGSIDVREMFFCHGNPIYNEIRDIVTSEPTCSMKLTHIQHHLARQQNTLMTLQDGIDKLNSRLSQFDI